eukprot:8063628-Pyramimonas_sp.AAC.1
MRAGRPLRGAKKASWLADSGRGAGRWAERRRASEALCGAKHGVPATRAGRPEGVDDARRSSQAGSQTVKWRPGALL